MDSEDVVEVVDSEVDEVEGEGDFRVTDHPIPFRRSELSCTQSNQRCFAL